MGRLTFGSCLILLNMVSCKPDTRVEIDTHLENLDTLNENQTDTYMQKINLAGVYVTVSGSKGGIMKDMEVHVRDTSIPDILSTKLQIDGEISKVHIADLNNDGKKEVYLFNTGSGSGSYGTVIGWQVSGKQLDTISIDEEATVSDPMYMGHDSFYSQTPYIIRNYPAYRESDANCCPSGGEKTVRYRLTKIQGLLKLVPAHE